MDWPAVATGVAAIVTGAGGIALAIREVRRAERRAANRAIADLEHELERCQSAGVELHKQNYALRVRLADEGYDVP